MSEWRDLNTRQFTYERSDYRALAVLGRPRLVAWLFGVAWVLLALVSLLIAVCWFAGSATALKYVPPVLLLLAAFLSLRRFGADISAWSLQTAARRSGLLRPQVMTVAEDVFRAESARGKTEVRWFAVPRVHAEEDRLFVFATPRLAYIIPRRAVPESFDEFVAAAFERWRSAPKEKAEQ